MKRPLCLFLCSVLAGCGFLHRDLVSRGVYRLEATEVGGCKVVATAVSRGGKLVVEGRLTGRRFASPPAAAVEVAVFSRAGTTLGKRFADLRLSHNRRASRTHAYFDAEFDEIPPPGSVIRIRAESPESLTSGCGEPHPAG